MKEKAAQGAELGGSGEVGGVEALCGEWGETKGRAVNAHNLQHRSPSDKDL